MPSAAHQALLLWAARKMACDGFEVAAYDGMSRQGGSWNALGVPPTFAGVRPDALGYNGVRLAFAEAKTEADIDTTHTRLQLRALVRLHTRPDGEACRLYLAIPRSAAPALDRVLAKLKLVGVPGIVRLHVPDILLEETA